MRKPLVSFIVPVYNREHTIDRCIRSLVAGGMTTESFTYEIVAIDDASTDDTLEHLNKWKKKHPYNFQVLEFKDHLERIYGFNAGILQAQGEWIVMIDSDDELASHFKEAFEDALEMYPQANLINWGSLVHWKNKDGRYYRTEKRETFFPIIGGQGVEKFKSGQIVSGGFAFKKSCLNVVGYLPPAKDPYTFGKLMFKEHPELVELYTLEDGRIQYDIGNPWGQDFAFFYKLTREFTPVGIPEVLHYIHVRP